MLENETGHRPLAYVKSQQIKELLQDSEQKVRLSLYMFDFSLLTFDFLYYLSAHSDFSAVHYAVDDDCLSCCCVNTV